MGNRKPFRLLLGMEWSIIIVECIFSILVRNSKGLLILIIYRDLEDFEWAQFVDSLTEQTILLLRISKINENVFCKKNEDFV